MLHEIKNGRQGLILHETTIRHIKNQTNEVKQNKTKNKQKYW